MLFEDYQKILSLSLPDKIGWPWTESRHSMPEMMPTGRLWPKISIVTPSYNQGKYLEETIRSVLLQGYPNLEYIIIDGGSSDESLEIIKKYEPWISYWVSEKDSGQSEAINKGITHATGEWIAWLNSDDLYFPHTFQTLAEIAAANDGVSWIVGTTIFIDNQHSEINRFNPEIYTASGRSKNYKKQGWLDYVCSKQSGIALPQPSSFWKRNIVLKAGCLDESLNFVMDHELYGRLAKDSITPYISKIHLAYFRVHSDQKATKFPALISNEEIWVVNRLIDQVKLDEKRVLKRYKFWFRYSIVMKWLKKNLYNLANSLKLMFRENN